MKKTKIIAEIGVNHNGKISNAGETVTSKKRYNYRESNNYLLTTT